MGLMPSIVELAEVTAYVDELLRVAAYDEGEPSNGLMVDTGRPVTRIAAAVNTSFRSEEPSRPRLRHLGPPFLAPRSRRDQARIGQ